MVTENLAYYHKEQLKYPGVAQYCHSITLKNDEIIADHQRCVFFQWTVVLFSKTFQVMGDTLLLSSVFQFSRKIRQSIDKTAGKIR